MFLKKKFSKILKKKIICSNKQKCRMQKFTLGVKKIHRRNKIYISHKQNLHQT
ncbi:hypothetical protein HanRHA438_Chr02g0093081 [Helianthus annuus]|nr:hypothetical protein HanRHA438_Chr02g0093081 [Helianthus annuus]